MKPTICADFAQNLREQFKSFARFYAGSFHLFPTLSGSRNLLLFPNISLAHCCAAVTTVVVLVV